MNYAEADRLLGFYTSGDVDRQSLINALAQCSQTEIDAIRKDIDDYDPNDNSQIVTILNKYGLNTNETPMNMNARIGDKNTMTYDEVMRLESGFYQDISPDAIQNALAQASEDEITTIRSVLANREDPAKATAILNKYGISTTEWMPGQSACFGDGCPSASPTAG